MNMRTTPRRRCCRCQGWCTAGAAAAGVVLAVVACGVGGGGGGGGGLILVEGFTPRLLAVAPTTTRRFEVCTNTALWVSAPLSQAVELDDVLDAPLMRDIEMLGNFLSEVVERENPRVHDLYQRFRQHGLNRAANFKDAKPALEKMIQCARDLSVEDAKGVMKTFGIALNLVNAAEVHHRLRVLRQQEMAALAASSADKVVGPLPNIEDSVCGTIQAILENGEASSTDEIYHKLVEEQRVEIVLTAHPTEVNRRTLLRKYRQIAELLAQLEDASELTHPYERAEQLESLRRLVASIWSCDEIRRAKPTPQQEAAGGIAILESVLWDAVPSYLRKLDAQCLVSLGRRLPMDRVPLKFASWIGGDRDGNPNVTPQVTREVVNLQRLRAAKLYLNDFHALYNELAISSKFSDELQILASRIVDSFDKREKYRRVIGHVRQRLIRTVKECEAELLKLASAAGRNDDVSSDDSMHIYSTMGGGAAADGASFGDVMGWQSVAPICTSQDLLEPLMVMHRSLCETGLELVADGLLADIIRRVHVFGVTLVPLDIREESTKHTEALDAVTGYLGLGSYKEWNEEVRLSFLSTELASKRPLFRVRDLKKVAGDDLGVLKTLRTFQMASELEPEALGAYVISQAQTASDVLCVLLLQKCFDMRAENANMMRVVPLFETLADLNNAPQVLETLFRMSIYMGAVRGRQEVMVGYSDSAKDAGRLAASWALYNSQISMRQVAQEAGVEITFFHGKGGTVGRGGNPALYRAILSHPPNTIQSRFRVTEQGEMITQNFGSPAIAERTLDIYTAAVLREAFVFHVEPTEEWKMQMSRISLASCEDYRHLVQVEPRFVPYFRQATPEVELRILNIGSRPAKRNPKGGIESLRAIPWTFAWTQTRTHLSAWLGVGAGLQVVDEAALREMYHEWPWFRETCNLIAMILSKTDFSLSKNYDDQLVSSNHDNDNDHDNSSSDSQDKEAGLTELGDEVREKLVETRLAIARVIGSSSAMLVGPHQQLMRASTKIRNPFVDPLNVVQAELLKRLRAMGGENGELFGTTESNNEERELLKDALVLSINAIAQGLRNSG